MRQRDLGLSMPSSFRSNLLDLAAILVMVSVVVPAVAHDGSGGCWYATDAGKVGRIGADDSHKSLSLEGGEVGWPDRIVPDGDWAWVVTRKGTHRVWLPPSAKP